ncbi:MAG TPA: hypothetical protein VHG88_15940 [Burkholderiales bacterium]|nr:hypothetical protein [Burkholderiales bacterium]
MRLAALFVAAAMAAGCAHTHTTGSTTTAGGSVSVQGHSNSLAALIFAGMFLAAAMTYREPPASPPELDASRRINEQDCSRPIDESAGNLRCR